MCVDYRKLCVELFGTDDVEALRKIAGKKKSGRKKKFSESDIDDILSLYSSGMTIEQIAKRYNTSRQIVSKYINAPIHKGCSMRMTYMFKKTPCTEIDIDFLDRKIYIQNKTDDILHRAFGANQSPVWEDFENFLEERCPPRTRGNIESLLRSMNIDHYDPISIIEYTKGRCVDDNMWIKIRYRSRGE